MLATVKQGRSAPSWYLITTPPSFSIYLFIYLIIFFTFVTNKGVDVEEERDPLDQGLDTAGECFVSVT